MKLKIDVTTTSRGGRLITIPAHDDEHDAGDMLEVEMHWAGSGIFLTQRVKDDSPCIMLTHPQAKALRKALKNCLDSEHEDTPYAR